jgi:hypothetical protein
VLANLDSLRASELYECQIEILTAARCGVCATIAREREDDFAAARRPNNDVVDIDPRGHSFRVETECVELT